MHACQRFQQARLADAIGPHQASHLTSLGLQVDAIKDLRAAIMKGKVFDFQHVQRPRYTSMTSWFLVT